MVYSSTILDLTRLADSTDSIRITENSEMAIQPSFTGSITGNVTIEVSNDNVTFNELDPLTTNYDVNEWVLVAKSPFLFYRFTVSTIGTGSVTFNVVIK